MALILIGYLALGTVMESFAIMIITVPIITPLVLNMGYRLDLVGHRDAVCRRDRHDPSTIRLERFRFEVDHS